MLWEKLDRVIGEATINDAPMRDHFNSQAASVKRHLEMVFHRFLENPDELKILLNDRLRKEAGFEAGEALEPWDPFLVEMSEELPPTHVPSKSGLVDIQPYILPHISRFGSDKESHARAGGINGWNAHQGFYIYRNRRMLVAGDWMGMYRQEEHTKLARIKVEFPNSQDFEWNLDVKKSRVIIPTHLKNDFSKIAATARGRAERIYRARGTNAIHNPNQPFVALWTQSEKRGKNFWSIDPKHPLVTDIHESLPLGYQRRFKNRLRLIGAWIPVKDTWIAQAENPDSVADPLEYDTRKQRHDMAKDLMKVYLSQGFSRADAIEAICNGIFPGFPDIKGLLEEII